MSVPAVSARRLDADRLFGAGMVAVTGLLLVVFDEASHQVDVVSVGAPAVSTVRRCLHLGAHLLDAKDHLLGSQREHHHDDGAEQLRF